MAEVEIVLPGMAGFAVAPSLGNKIRGAIGTVLLRSASAAVRQRRPCDWAATCPAEVFFGRRPSLELGDYASEIAKPFVLEAQGANDGSLMITIRLFGFAVESAGTMAGACVTALRECVRWQDLARDSASFLPRQIEPSRVDLRHTDALALPERPGAVHLVFHTSMDAERGDPVDTPNLVLVRLVRRLALLAPWHGVSLKAAFGALQVAAQAAPVERMDACSVLTNAIGGHKFLNALAAPCRYAVEQLTEPLWTAIALGTQTHIGRGAALGLGRYTIEAAPQDRAFQQAGTGDA